MPLQVFQIYMIMCRKYGTTPTWEGLREFGDHIKKATQACTGAARQ